MYRRMDEATERIIREEVFKDDEDPEEGRGRG
jgi:hypothetical protein